MRRSIAIILSFALLLQTFYAISIVTFYYANKNYVAATLCENKDKPQLHCQGKCFLKKELKNAEGESHKGKKVSEQQETVLALPIMPMKLSVVFQPSADKPETFFRENQYRHLFLNDTFHPPGITC